MTGMREQEVMHTYWSDLNLTNLQVMAVIEYDILRHPFRISNLQARLVSVERYQ